MIEGNHHMSEGGAPTAESIKKVRYFSKGRDAHTINECMCTFCKGCVYSFFHENQARNRCPSCKTELGGKPLETIVRDMTLQNIVDWLIPDFKERDDKFKSILLMEANKRRVFKGKLDPDVLVKKKHEIMKTDESNS